ncbi:uncharacterized protein LOC108602508 [Drosophila busckii]|uniref:uncharacterized protein LOC108602508 n=1 Tax=Drosophila busckii TaxID=30019 RepID=UPI00143312EC|nr:uncharacterized protein LOC108602508 [Drosophila busckii]
MDGKERNSSCDQSYEDDNRSNYSEAAQQNGEQMVQEETPIRVRDMINIYNFATQKNQELAHVKSLYFGANQAEANECYQQQQQQQQQECCNSISFKMPEVKPGNFRVTSSDNQTSLRQSIDCDQAGVDSVEKSYQSKTTIRRTEDGVRIIIDIFFDKTNTDIDIVNSRVETDIPESRILADFQQHSLDLHSQQMKSHQP